MEGFALNCVKIRVENYDMKIFQELESHHHTKYIVKPSEYENNYINIHRNYTLTYFINSC